jgi:hypothetical protein
MRFTVYFGVRRPSLTEGQSLIIPPGVFRMHQSAATYIPYDAGRFVGPTDPSPLFPAPPKSNYRCGAFGAVLRTAIALVVSRFNPLRFIPVVGGATSSIISQGINIGLGLQRRFDWDQVAYAAIYSAVDTLNPLNYDDSALNYCDETPSQLSS